MIGVILLLIIPSSSAHQPLLIYYPSMSTWVHSLLLDNPQRCDCYPVLTDTLNIMCNITKGTG